MTLSAKSIAMESLRGLIVAFGDEKQIVKMEVRF
ncbi:uncharacterized protein RAG0_03434 [Rhynchosporium agropyri]|uniref:Uncharacterized protein n=1 Tax=Rhynchosporium agropyri TaxID=914238 RepID=A0A1E1K4C5_9HELO|nr:uncharacterized protein RAG0_03434 [Rhynchosporium agropyri]